MKQFLKKVSEWGLVGILVTFGLSFTGIDPTVGKVVGNAAEQASDNAIERYTEE